MDNECSYLQVNEEKLYVRQYYLKVYILHSITIALISYHVVAECRYGWLHYGSSCYYFSNDSRDWVSAAVSVQISLISKLGCSLYLSKCLYQAIVLQCFKSLTQRQ
jgi:hypothetical protein